MRTLAMWFWLWAQVLCSPAVFAKVGDYYFGDYYTYTLAETYESILGGQVSLLEPGGYDYFLQFGISSAVLLEGPISAESAGVVERLLKAHPRIRTIFLDSPGGDLFAGMRIGQLIAAGRLKTVVNNAAQCQSACALAFLAGEHRLLLGKESDFGFHRQYYIVDGQPRYAAWERDVAQIGVYLRTIDSKAISAEEIVGTTQQVSMTQERLRERGVTSSTAAEYATYTWVTTKLVTAYETFRSVCHAFEMTPTCRQLPPVLEEPRLKLHALAKRLKGNDADVARAREALARLSRILEGASVQALFDLDCRGSQPSFAAAMQEKAYLASLHLKGEELANFQSKRQLLERRCQDLQASTPESSLPGQR